jgi:hypothetical protein
MGLLVPCFVVCRCPLRAPALTGCFSRGTTMQSSLYLRRKPAGEYLKTKFGFGSEKSLAKLACLGGGPAFRKAGAAVLYTHDDLDAWALAQISKPLHSTSELEVT